MPMAYQYALIRQSRAFMEQHHAEQIALEHMAAAALMSRFYYIRMFKQIYGVTPRQYLRDLRITKAKALIRVAVSPVVDLAAILLRICWV